MAGRTGLRANQPRGRRMRTGAILPLLVFGVCAGFAGGAGLALWSAPTERILPGVHVEGIPIGGLTVEEAAERLAPLAEEIDRPILLQVEEQTWQMRPSDWGVLADLQATVQNAYSLGRGGSPVGRFLERAHAFLGRPAPLILSTDAIRFEQQLEALALGVDRAPQPARIVAEGGAAYVIPDEPGLRLHREQTRFDIHWIARRRQERQIRLRVERLPADFGLQQAQALVPDRLIAEASTRFNPADQDRTTNIRLAAAAIDGAIVGPGESFSFNGRVGPAEPDRGFRQAPIILNGELTPGFGGGICQVSTTLYNALLLAGLPILERTPHSLPPAYVPMGMDAAVVYGVLDLRFHNPTDGFVMIKASVGRDTLTVQLLAAADAPRPPATTRLANEIDDVIEPEWIVVTDPGLPAGARIIEREARPGYRVSTYRVTQSPGASQEERVLAARTSYPVRHGLVRVGPEEGTIR